MFHRAILTGVALPVTSAMVPDAALSSDRKES